MQKDNGLKPASNGRDDTKTLVILTHILGIVAGFIPSLVILLVSKDELVKKHAKNALNWQISFLIYYIISMILIFIIVGILLVVALIILNIVFCIIATVKANNGEIWKYPLSIKFFKN